jgi:alpha-galactosidase
MDLDAAHPQQAEHGRWNDPDYIVPNDGMTLSESRAQVSMWAILAAPLMVSVDISRASTATLSLLTNPAVIAIDQDPLGRQGQQVIRRPVETWVKPLARGDLAVALLNRDTRGHSISTEQPVFAVHRRSVIRDVWSGRVVPHGSIITVAAHSATLLRISRAWLDRSHTSG